MKNYGLTLVELTTSLSIVCILLFVGVPSLVKEVRQSKMQTEMLTLLDAIQTARSTAVLQNQNTLLISTNGLWHKGWMMFVDSNKNGSWDAEEKQLLVNQGLDATITSANSPIKGYVGFIGTGEGRQIKAGGSGGFLSGTIKLCPTVGGDGYSIVLSKSGRARVEELPNTECALII